ncbi:pre-mRNA-splicing factor CWC26 [Candida albicans P76067]|nr:pre-mRNA-splicing factor CWC26 [Candida albicans P76067]
MASFIKDTTTTTITTTTKKEFEDVSKSKFVYNKGINIPNRFNIPAGYFWDGIDRSNGFEQMYLRKQTEYNYDKIDSKINETYEIDIGDD